MSDHKQSLIDDISEGFRIIVFGTDDSLRRLCASDIVSIDGTFKVCHRVFYQLCVIHSHTWAPAGIFVGGSEPQKGPPKDEKGPPQKKLC